MRSVRSPAPAASLSGRLLRAAGSCALLTLCCTAAPAGAASDDAHAWLARADQALATRNYEGVFVHEHAGGESETLRVVHRVSDGEVAERLLSMDGSGREFIRKGTELICYLPDQHTVLVERSPDASLMLGGVPRSDAITAGQYEVKTLSSARVLGRAAHVIAITPLDGMRYGYRVWIDEATAMPLKTQLRDSNGGVLEQMVFTSLSLPAHIADAELETTIDARNYRWVRHDSEAIARRHRREWPSWQASALPPGFRMLASSHQMLHGGPVQHLVFSDGLASVSVFIERGPAGSSDAAGEDIANLGTSSAYATIVQGYRVIAVGEVPPGTVRAIAQSIRNAAADAAGASTPDASGGEFRGATPVAPLAPPSLGDGAAAFGDSRGISEVPAPGERGLASGPGPR
jgi:sigma-E factor negative regulatory protein RseB